MLETRSKPELDDHNDIHITILFRLGHLGVEFIRVRLEVGVSVYRASFVDDGI